MNKPIGDVITTMQLTRYLAVGILLIWISFSAFPWAERMAMIVMGKL